MAKTPATKTLLIGWDAADWQIINPLLKAGKMPTLARFIKEGTSGNLATIQPMLSPMLWTSIVTAKRADKHGIYGFVEPAPEATSIRPVSSHSRTCKALWNILSQEQLRSIVVGWFASFPAEPIQGAVVSNLFAELKRNKDKTLSLPEGCIHPPELAQELADLHVSPAEIMAKDLMPFIPKLKEIDFETDKRPQKLAKFLARAASVQAAATHLMSTQPWDFTAVYFQAIDHFGHIFMPYHPPKMDDVSEQDFSLYHEVMEGCYRFHDMMLHALLQQAGEETNVIIVSDHGYRSGKQRPDPKTSDTEPESWHRNMGIVCMRGPKIKRDEKLYGATILDVTPTILNLFGLPAGMDMDGRSWLEAFTQAEKIEPIFSWENREGDAGLLDKEAGALDPEAAAESLQQLIDLGYISPPDENTQKQISNTILDNKTNLIRALLDSRRVDEAIPLLEDLIKAHPDNDWFPLALAQAQLKCGQLTKAKERLSTLNQQDAQVQVLLADIAIEEKQGEQALEHLEQAKKENPELPQVAFKQGQSLLILKKLDQAETAFKQALKEDPQNAFAYNGLAEIHLRNKKSAEAIEAALEAVGLYHHFPQAHYNLGLALFQMGQEEEAICALETCANMIGGVSNADPLLAKLYHKDNRDLEKAKFYWERFQSAKNSPPFFFKDAQS